MQTDLFISIDLCDKKGYTCPHCGAYHKLYKRKLNSSQALGLIDFYRHWKRTGEEWVSVTKFNGSAFRGGDFAKLRFWGLTKEAPNTDESKKTSGIWSLTAKGSEFVTGRIKVPKYVMLKDGELKGFSNELIRIQDALGSKFNYSELMK